MVKMFAVVVFIFVVCWAPYHIYFIYSYHNPQITKATNLLKLTSYHFLTRPECLIVAKNWLFELKSVTYRLIDHGLLSLELLSQLKKIFDNKINKCFWRILIPFDI